MKIGIIVGSIRDNCNGTAVGQWVAEQAASRTDAEFELIELKKFGVPLLTDATLPMMANKQYPTEAVNQWSKAVDACDAYVFVTPEYNHGVPGAFKNAVDSLGSEWVGKAVGFVSYGAESGVRSVEQWRQIVSNFSMVDVRAQVSFGLFTEFGESGFQPGERRAEEISTLFDQLVEITGKLRG